MVNEIIAKYTYKNIKDLNDILEQNDVANFVFFPLFEVDVKYITEQFYKKVFGPKIDIQKLENFTLFFYVIKLTPLVFESLTNRPRRLPKFGQFRF